MHLHVIYLRMLAKVWGSLTARIIGVAVVYI